MKIQDPKSKKKWKSEIQNQNPKSKKMKIQDPKSKFKKK